MENTCQRCHAEIVPHDAAFCSSCGLPQLRVSADAVELAEADSQVNNNPEAQPSPGDVRADWRFAIRCAFIVALPAAFLFLLGLRFEPAALMLFLWVLCGALLTVLLYHRGRPSLPMTYRVGARIGSITGALIALLLFIAFSIATFNMRMRNDARVSDAEYLDRIKDVSARYQVDPKMQAWAVTPEFRAGATVFSSGVYGLILVGMSAITGAIGATVLSSPGTRRHQR